MLYKIYVHVILLKDLVKLKKKTALDMSYFGEFTNLIHF
jgi:hypothetical protein